MTFGPAAVHQRFVFCLLTSLLTVAGFCTSASASASAAESSNWLTIAGAAEEPFNTNQNVVQVDPASISDVLDAKKDGKDDVTGEIRPTHAGLRTMRVRVSRAAKRDSWDGVPYRSFTAIVEFDCPKKTARYVSLDYYLEPAWRGNPHNTSVYKSHQFRAMAFRDITPNPTQRIIRAACDTASVSHN